MKKYFIILLGLVLVGCVKTSANVEKKEFVSMKLENKEYKIEKIIDKKTNTEYPASSDWSIILDDTRFGMYIGCNRIFGLVEQKNSTLTYINPASTKMMCLEQMMKAENAVLKSLTKMNILEDGLENDDVKIIFAK